VNPITHDEVAQATARFLAAGGTITQLPDTTAQQAEWLHYEEWLEHSRLDILVMEKVDAAVL